MSKHRTDTNITKNSQTYENGKVIFYQYDIGLNAYIAMDYASEMSADSIKLAESHSHIPPQTKAAIPILTIAGSDCSGGAGIQADLKTFSAHGLFGMSVILSVVAENTSRVISAYDVPTQSIDEQFEAVFEDIPPMACKVGMLGSLEIIECVRANLLRYKPKNCVIDPVMFAKNGFPLMPKDCQNAFKEKILPLSDVLTPNIPEAEALCGFAITDIESMQKAAIALHDMGAKHVLLKGGHSAHNADDVFFEGCIYNENGRHKGDGDKGNMSKNNGRFHILQSPKIDTKNTHGTGCTLSSAIAANLALGFNMGDSITRAKAYVFQAILHSLSLGKGNGPTNHFF